jgi:hypothetical protein
MTAPAVVDKPIDNPSNPAPAAEPKDPPGQPPREPPAKEPAAPVRVPDDKPAAEKKDEKPAEPQKPVVPEKYDLKLPDDSGLDATLSERTAAIARELGLSNEHAQKALEFVAQEAQAHADAIAEATIQSYQKGGTEWTKRVAEWQQTTAADPALGKTPEERQAAINAGKTVLRKYGETHPDDELQLTAYLDNAGLSDHPAVARFFAWLGKAMGEGEYVRPGAPSSGQPRWEDQMYPTTAKKD